MIMANLPIQPRIEHPQLNVGEVQFFLEIKFVFASVHWRKCSRNQSSLPEGLVVIRETVLSSLQMVFLPLH